MDKLLQRSNGKIDIELLDNDFSKFFQSGCCKILNPKNYNDNNELILINTAGGITCNDNIKINAVLLNGVNSSEKDFNAWAEYIKINKVNFRYIELMQTGDNLDYFNRCLIF